MYYDNKALSDQVEELKSILGIKEEALQVCSDGYANMSESLVVIQDTLSVLETMDLEREKEIAKLRNQNDRLKGIVKVSCGVTVAVIGFQLVKVLIQN